MGGRRGLKVPRDKRISHTIFRFVGRDFFLSKMFFIYSNSLRLSILDVNMEWVEILQKLMFNQFFILLSRQKSVELKRQAICLFNLGMFWNRNFAQKPGEMKKTRICMRERWDYLLKVGLPRFEIWIFSELLVHSVCYCWVAEIETEGLFLFFFHLIDPRTLNKITFTNTELDK
jgi:hypothetical protein